LWRSPFWVSNHVPFLTSSLLLYNCIMFSVGDIVLLSYAIYSVNFLETVSEQKHDIGIWNEKAQYLDISAEERC